MSPLRVRASQTPRVLLLACRASFLWVGVGCGEELLWGPGGGGVCSLLPSRAFLLLTKALGGLGPEGKAHSFTM